MIECIHMQLYRNISDKTVFRNKLMPFPLVNKTNFVKYQGYPNKHIYIVVALDLFRILYENQWKAALKNNAVQTYALIYLKICY